MEKLNSFLRAHRVSTVFALLTAAVMYIIFAFSSQSGGESSAASAGVSRFIAELIVSGFDKLSELERELKIEELVPIVRKCAHFCVFCALGFFANLSAHSFAFERNAKISPVKNAYTAAFCIIYAVLDEAHQLFSPGRSCQFTDVLIDFSGSILGIATALLCFTIFKRIYTKRKTRG